MRQNNDRPEPWEEQKEQEPGFAQMIQMLPGPLMQKVIKLIGAAAAFVLLVVILVITTKLPQAAWGVFFGVFLMYQALSLVWKYFEGKIICKSMVCIKATKIGKERMHLILREMETDTFGASKIHKFYLAGSKNAQAMITQNTIMDIYYDPRQATQIAGEIVAWEITGNL